MEFIIGVLWWLTVLIICTHQPVTSEIQYECSNSNSCNITNVQKNDYEFSEDSLKDFKTTKFIFVQHSSLDNFPVFILNGMPNLENITAYKIGLKNIDVFASKIMRNIRKLNLGGNKLTSLGPRAFRSTRRLIELRLYENRISEIDVSAFDDLSELLILDLWKNSISFLDEDTFFDLASIKSIYLRDNNIKQMNLDLFINNHDLNKVRVEYNGMTSIQSFQANKNLNYLLFAYNDLSDISALVNITEIKGVDLAGNNKLILNEFTFVKMPSFEYLRLTDADLSKLNHDYSLFKPLKYLKTLHFNKNNLQSLDFNNFPRLLRLEHLDISGNNLTVLNVDNIRKKFPKLNTIVIGNNNFECDYLRSLVAKLNSFDVKLTYLVLNPIAKFTSIEVKNNSTSISGIGCYHQNKESDEPEILLNTQCGTNTEKVALISGGSQSKRGMWPWLIAVFHKTPLMDKFICGASLLNEHFSITAAHCIQEHTQVLKLRAKDIRLHIGRYNIEDKLETEFENTNVKNIIVHPDWLEVSSYGHDADLALLVLEKPVRYGAYIQPICLWQGSDDIKDIVHTNGTVVGWGRQNKYKKTSNVPWMAEIEIISKNTCVQYGTAYFQITSDRTFCGRSNDGSGPCTGDSGGGFYIKRGQQWLLRGIISVALKKNGDKCDLEKPVVYTDVAKFLKWIYTNINFHSAV